MNSLREEEVEHLTAVEEGASTKVKLLYKKLKLPLLIILVLALVGFGVWFFLLRTPAEEGVVEVETRLPREPPPFGEVYFIRDMVINPSGGRRLFMVSIALEYFDKEKASEFKRREPLLRDNLTTLFSSQPPEVLTNIKYRRALRSRVKKIMDYQLGEGVVTRIFFEKWVFQ